MGKIMVIGLGGFSGAVLRYLISQWVYVYSTGQFPLGTILVNSIGSFIIGFLAGFSGRPGAVSQPNPFLTIGLLGAFTTFSTFSYETMILMKRGALSTAMLNVFGNIVTGMIFVYLGFILGQMSGKSLGNV